MFVVLLANWTRTTECLRDMSKQNQGGDILTYASPQEHYPIVMRFLEKKETRYLILMKNTYLEQGICYTLASSQSVQFRNGSRKK